MYLCNLHSTVIVLFLHVPLISSVAIDAAGFEPTSFPTKTVRRITNDASRQLGGATSCKLACNWDCLSSKSPGIIQWSDCLMLIAQSLSHWQGFAPCMVLFVRAPTTKPLPATQKPYLSYKRLPIPPQWHKDGTWTLKKTKSFNSILFYFVPPMSF